jgi:hypothetical protein
MKKAIGFIAMSILTVALAFGFETTKTLNLSAAGIDKLDIDAGAGFLKVSGAEGLSGIEVEARIVIDGVADKDMESYLKDHVELELRKSGATAVLKGLIHDRGFFRFGGEAKIDLTVRMPRAMALAVDDGSGALEIEDIGGAVRVDDGSGSLRVSRVAGDLRIDDGSGEITVENVGGNLDIVDGSGGIARRWFGQCDFAPDRRRRHR